MCSLMSAHIHAHVHLLDIHVHVHNSYMTLIIGVDVVDEMHGRMHPS